jgi:hypothetical protein
MYRFCLSSSVRGVRFKFLGNPKLGWVCVPSFRNPGFRKSGTRNPSGFSFSETREPVVAFYKMKDKLNPDTPKQRLIDSRPGSSRKIFC